MKPLTNHPRGAARYPRTSDPAPTLLVNETFLSIQGEGPEQGYPTFFIRLTGCNLRCAYCDSVYAFAQGTRRALSDVVEEARRSGVNRVLVTGGEPLAQAAAPRLCRDLLKAGLKVSLETNGSFGLDGLPAATRRVVDVKTPGSGEGGSFLPSVLCDMRKGDALKFVLVDREDYLWTRDFLRAYTLPSGVETLLSCAWGKLDPGMLAGWLLEDRLSVRLQLQLHKMLWGDRRGV
jgi:7-carboxy-7-deazaguanine synthase